MARSFTAMPRRPLDWGDEDIATRVRSDAACLTLIAREGPLAGQVYGSDGDPVTIGRASGCAVHLPLADISRRHARVRYHAGRFWIEDLGTVNGTYLNKQLIDRPTQLKAGDRVRVGDQDFDVRFELHPAREVVHDADIADEDQRGGRDAASPWLRLLTLAVLVVLPVAVALAVIVIRWASRPQTTPLLTRPTVVATAAPAPAANVPVVATAVPTPPAVTAAPTTAPAGAAGPVVTPMTARLELDGAVVLTADSDGVVRKAAPRGRLVREGDLLLRYRRSDDKKRRELDRLNAKLEEDEDNKELTRRARELAEELADEPEAISLKSSSDGLVVEVPAVGAKVQAGTDVVRLARALRIFVDSAAIVGNGSNCRVRLLDQKLDIEGRRVITTMGPAIEATRFPAALRFDRVGRVSAECN
jgi:hypothetical protein